MFSLIRTFAAENNTDDPIIMGEKIKKLKKIRIHREGTNTLFTTFLLVAVVAVGLWFGFDSKIPFWSFVVLFGAAWLVVLNFYRCPIRYFNGETEKVVVAPADGRIVVIEEVHETRYFNVLFVKHQNGNYHKAWLPKASEENERADIMIETADGQQVLCRQIAGAMARRIVTYAKEGEDCYIDEHLGFIKLGSRVDVYLPLGSEPCVKMGQATTGDQTMIARLS